MSAGSGIYAEARGIYLVGETDRCEGFTHVDIKSHDHSTTTTLLTDAKIYTNYTVYKAPKLSLVLVSLIHFYHQIGRAHV